MDLHLHFLMHVHHNYFQDGWAVNKPAQLPQ